MVLRSFKTELAPNNEQFTKLLQHAGCARFAYNWAMSFMQNDFNNKRLEEQIHLAERRIGYLVDYTEEELKEYRKELNKRYLYPNAMTLHKILISKKEEEFPWMYDVSKWSPQNALIALQDAYERFFKIIKDPKKKRKSKKSKKKKKGIYGFPKRKKRDKKDSFTVDTPVIVTNKDIQLPKIGKIRLKERGYIPEGKPKKATVSRKGDRWFVSVSYEVKIEKKEYSKEKLGVDLGIKSLATCSDGTIIKNSNKLNKLEKKLKRYQRKLARQKDKCSNSRKRTKKIIQSIHYRIACARKDILHKATTLLMKTKSEGTVVLEDLNVSGMMKNHKLAKAIANVGLYEFRRQCQYKSEWYGKKLEFIDMFYPSSKLCSKCGKVKEDLKLSDRVYKCECGNVMDRDLNASVNIRDCANTVRYTGIHAGGDGRFIQLPKGERRCPSEKPESNRESNN